MKNVKIINLNFHVRHYVHEIISTSSTSMFQSKFYLKIKFVSTDAQS